MRENSEKFNEFRKFAEFFNYLNFNDGRMDGVFVGALYSKAAC